MHVSILYIEYWYASAIMGHNIFSWKLKNIIIYTTSNLNQFACGFGVNVNEFPSDQLMIILIINHSWNDFLDTLFRQYEKDRKLWWMTIIFSHGPIINQLLK